MSLFGTHFYHRTIRKMRAAFGSLFNEIQLVRYKYVDNVPIELERKTVPLVHAQKEKYILRTQQDPDLTKSLQSNLPIITYWLSNLTPDYTRKLNTLIANRAVNTEDNSLAKKQLTGVPYNFEYTVSIIARNVEDGWQIVEQILPMFTPDYTLRVNLNSTMGQIINVPVMLDGITHDIQDDGDGSTMRICTWDLTFTLKAGFFGPVTDGKLITKANTNIYFDDVRRATVLYMNANSGFGTFKDNEYVYQGYSFDTANVKAQVVDWDANNSILYVIDVRGRNSDPGYFKENVRIRGVDSGAGWTFESFNPANATPVLTITVEPSPNTANMNSEFEYNITMTEVFE